MSSLTWIGHDGVPVLLDGTAGLLVTAGVLGVDAPSSNLNTAPLLSTDGSVLVKERKTMRRLVLPLLVTGTGAGGARVPMAAVLRSMIAGGTLRYTGYHIRDLIGVRYESGAEQGGFGLDAGVAADEMYVISLLALDPWWYGASTSTGLTFASAAVAFDNAGTAFDAAVAFDAIDANPVTVAGDASAYPTVTIVGPFTTLTVGLAGGETFTLAAALAAGSTVVVSTAPGSRGPRINGGSIDWSLLTPASRLWTLPVGGSVLLAEGSGSTGASSIEVGWRERWLMP